MSGILFFIFASCEPLMYATVKPIRLSILSSFKLWISSVTLLYNHEYSYILNRRQTKDYIRDRSLFLPGGGAVGYGVGHDFFDELKRAYNFFDS